MASFAQLLVAGERSDPGGWAVTRMFGWGGEATSWVFEEVLADRLQRVDSALDLQVGDGSRLAVVPELPDHTVATTTPEEVGAARAALAERGVWVLEHAEGENLPLPANSFQLVTAKGPAHATASEIARVLAPGGSYLAQLLGPAGGFELLDYFLGPDRGTTRLADTLDSIRLAGLDILDTRVARVSVELRDIGAVVFALRKLLWVPDFSIERYAARLATLHDQIRREGAVVTQATRYLIEAVKPDAGP